VETVEATGWASHPNKGTVVLACRNVDALPERLLKNDPEDGGMVSGLCAPAPQAAVRDGPDRDTSHTDQKTKSVSVLEVSL